ncbi:MAG: response regulator transcription factor [Chitinophagales bacterium]|jgi:two-component system LytT family response regulator|nr:response regulator transcription factor [Chitinophagales bacterium]
MKSTEIRAVIIDDEIAARELLTLHLQNHCPQVNIVGAEGNFRDGLALLEAQKPDLVFLDIELNDASGGGIELIESYGRQDIAIIFFTGYDKYVEESYRLHAVHYIKKPISIVALKEAVARAEQYIAMQKPQPLFYKLSTLKGIEFIPLKDIIFLEAKGAVTYIHIITAKNYKGSSETLGEIERQLPPKDFYRIHRSYIVNRKYVAEYRKEGFIVLLDGRMINIAAGHVKGFIQWLGQEQ